ncbi:MAG TPA: hypothetical protein VIW93_04165 [Candidatus Acidoferrum sp.]
MKLKLNLFVAAQVLFAAFLSRTVMAAPPPPETARQHFVCNTGYTPEKCHADVAVLRLTLANYPMVELGDWTWILVRSEDWKALIQPRGFTMATPAFTYYAKRETFIEEALVTEVPARSRELLLKWNMSRRDLLEFAITHELGHVFCNDKDESNANRVGQLLKEGKTPSCRKP